MILLIYAKTHRSLFKAYNPMLNPGHHLNRSDQSKRGALTRKRSQQSTVPHADRTVTACDSRGSIRFFFRPSTVASSTTHFFFLPAIYFILSVFQLFSHYFSPSPHFWFPVSLNLFSPFHVIPLFPSPTIDLSLLCDYSVIWPILGLHNNPWGKKSQQLLFSEIR